MLLTWHECDNLPLKGLMEPAVIHPKPTVFRGTEDIGVACPTTRAFDVRSFWLVTIFFESREAPARHLIARAIMA